MKKIMTLMLLLLSANSFVLASFPVADQEVEERLRGLKGIPRVLQVISEDQEVAFIPKVPARKGRKIHLPIIVFKANKRDAATQRIDGLESVDNPYSSSNFRSKSSPRF